MFFIFYVWIQFFVHNYRKRNYKDTSDNVYNYFIRLHYSKTKAVNVLHTKLQSYSKFLWCLGTTQKYFVNADLLLSWKNIIHFYVLCFFSYSIKYIKWRIIYHSFSWSKNGLWCQNEIHLRVQILGNIWLKYNAII